MTALTVPARQDRDLRPVPWRKMAWVTWRQHRIALAGVAALLGGGAVYLLIMGLSIHHAYAAAAACHPWTSDACGNLVGNFLSTYWGGAQITSVLLQLAPVLIGAFVGAPVLARELETGTFRFIWTQGFGRARWAAAKLTLLAVAVTAAAGAFSVPYSWYIRPFLAAPVWQRSSLAGEIFDLKGIAFAAWTLAAFAIGALAGLLIRRVVPAMAATLAVYAGLAFTTTLWLRPHYLAPLVTNSARRPAGQWRHGVAGQPVVYRAERQAGQPGRDRPPPPGVQSDRHQGRAERVQDEHLPAAVPRPARVHAADEDKLGQPVLALPVDRGRLAARALADPHRRDHLAGCRRAA